MVVRTFQLLSVLLVFGLSFLFFLFLGVADEAMARRRISAYGPVRLPDHKAELISLFPQPGRRGIIDGIDRGLPASVWQTSVHAPGL